jgi:hypothetical protein
MWSSPLKPLKTIDETKPDKVKKPKPRISKGTAKKLLEVEVADSITALWVEDYLDNMVRTYCYPPQLVSDEFFGLLAKYFDESKRAEILKAVKDAYNRVKPPEPEKNTVVFKCPEPEKGTPVFKYLLEAIESDPRAKTYISELKS